MRTKEEVTERFHSQCRMRLRQRQEKFLSRSNLNCVHNCQLRVRRVGKVGFCQNPDVLAASKTRMFVCNDDEQARGCPHFECRRTEDDVVREFWEVLRSPSRCGSEYPKLAVLIWFLQEVEPSTRGQRFKAVSHEFVRYLWSLVSFEWW